VQLAAFGVRPQGLDHDAPDRLGPGDQDVGEPARRQFDHEVVDGPVGAALDDVEAEDVGAGLTERRRDGAEHPRAVGQHDAQQIRHVASMTQPRCALVAPAWRGERHLPALQSGGVPPVVDPGAPVPEISREQVAHLARLARLALDDVELDGLAAELEVILGAVARVREVTDAEGVRPTTHAVPLENVTRPDVVRPSLPREDVLAGAPVAEDGRFRVPRILDAE